jgi:hypothetical protein
MWSAMPRWLVLAVLLGATACAKPVPASVTRVLVGAAVTAAAVVAHHAITGCSTSCSSGLVCDEESGRCVQAGRCAPRDPDCGKTPGYSVTTQAAGPEEEPDQTCGGYCRSDERCVVRHHGDLRCVARGPSRSTVQRAF